MKTIGNSNRIQPAYTVGNAPTNNVAYTDLANAFTLAQSISLATAGTIFSLITTENNATAQAVDLYRHRAGAAGQDGDDLTELQFNGLDDNGTPQKTKYARILAEIADASDTTEDGRLSLGTMRAGSVVDWRFESGAFYYQTLTLPTTTGGINVAELNLNNVNIGSTCIQTVIATPYTTYTAHSATHIPSDDTIPQQSEALMILSQSFTPKSASSTIIIRSMCQIIASGAGGMGIAALWKDATANAVKTAFTGTGSSQVAGQVEIEYSEASGSTSARTYKVGVAADTGTLYINGISSGRQFGGTSSCTMIIQEFL